MTNATTTDHAADIRKALKAQGWTSRDVSVRADYYSMGSSIRIIIKNAAVPMHVVERIAKGHEVIHYDHYVGEILSGANRFVDVRYSSDAIAQLAAPLMPALQAAEAELLTADDNALIPVAGTPFCLGFDGNHYGTRRGRSLWRDGHIQSANEIAHLAGTAAIKMQELR